MSPIFNELSHTYSKINGLETRTLIETHHEKECVHAIRVPRHDVRFFRISVHALISSRQRFYVLIIKSNRYFVTAILLFSDYFRVLNMPGITCPNHADDANTVVDW